MGNKFEPASLITIESSGYARPFDRMPVEKHTCRHPRRDVEGFYCFALHRNTCPQHVCNMSAPTCPQHVCQDCMGPSGETLGGNIVFVVRRRHGLGFWPKWDRFRSLIPDLRNGMCWGLGSCPPRRRRARHNERHMLLPAKCNAGNNT